MDINFLAVFVVAVLHMIIGMVWYGKLFGKKWMEFMGTTNMSEAEMKAMQKASTPLYGIQFVMSLVSNSFLAYAISLGLASGVMTAFVLWLGVIMPIQTGVMWDNMSGKTRVQKFLVLAGYQLVCMLIAGCIFQAWV
jgi:hypothetical protein